MKPIVIQLAEKQEIIGSNISHLANNPQDFLDLMTLNLELAIAYAKHFSPGHALTLLSTAQTQNLPVLQRILDMQPSQIALSSSSLDFQSKSFNEKLKIAKSMTQNLKKSTVCIESYSDEHWRRFQTDYYMGNDHIFSEKFYQPAEEGPTQFTLTKDDQVLEKAYKQIHHSEWVKTKTLELVSHLLAKLDSTITLQDKSGRRVALLDGEMVEKSAYTRVLRGSQSVFNHLVERQNYPLITKVLSLLSPKMALVQLKKLQSNHVTLLARIIDQIPTCPDAAREMIKQLQALHDLDENLFKSAMRSFGFDIHQKIQHHSPELARSFYEISPAFMQSEFPQSAVDLPPSYDEEPVFNHKPTA